MKYCLLSKQNVSGTEISYLEQNYVLILDKIHWIKSIIWLILRFCPFAIQNDYKSDAV